MHRTTSRSDRTRRRSRLPALLLVGLMLTLPAAAAVTTTTWSGPSPVAAGPSGTVVPGFNLSRNATVLDAGLTLSGAPGGQLNAMRWTTHGPTPSLHEADLVQTTFDRAGGSLTLAPDPAWTIVDGLEQASLQLPAGWRRGGQPATQWQVLEPSAWLSSLTNVTQVNESLLTPAGWLPANASSGQRILGTYLATASPAGADSWLRSPAWRIPKLAANYTLAFDHVHDLAMMDANGSGDAAWLEVSLDAGSTWRWIAPEGGYPGLANASAPLPAGLANGSTRVPAFTGEQRAWQRVEFVLDDLPGLGNASDLMVRFRHWTTAAGGSHTGWFVDNLTLANDPTVEYTWFHGSLTGAYADGAHSELVMPLDLSTATSPSTLSLNAAWDLEGNAWDNFHVEIATTNASGQLTNWTGISPVGGIPGRGISVGGATYGDDSGGWVGLGFSIPAAAIGDPTVWLRIRVETDTSIGYGNGQLSPPEGVFIDDVVVTSLVNGSVIRRSAERFDTNATAWHGGLPASSGPGKDQWQHVARNASGFQLADDFEAAQHLPEGFSVVGSGWQWGSTGTVNVGPGGFTSGSKGFGVILDNDYLHNTWTILTTPEYPWLPGANGRLTFDHWMCAEDAYDGGTVFISTDRGVNWRTFGDISWYDNTMTRFDSPLVGEPVFDGPGVAGFGQAQCAMVSQNPWRTMTHEVGSIAADSVMFRFAFASDDSVRHDGWYLDDIGVEVDRWLPIGNWTSRPLTVPEDGLGVWSLAAEVPNGAHVRGSVLDASGEPLPWLDGVRLPVPLLGLEVGETVRLRLELSTDDPTATPVVHGMHLGGARMLRGPGGDEVGWSMPTGLEWDVNGSRWRNVAGSTVEVVLPWMQDTAPVTALHFEMAGQGVRAWATDAVGGRGLAVRSGQTLTPAAPWSGWGAVIEVTPGGWLGNVTLTPTRAAPASGLAVATGGLTHWSFTGGETWGSHGWQDELRHAAHPQNTSVGSILLPSGEATSLYVRLPAAATSLGGWIDVGTAKGEALDSAPQLAAATLSPVAGTTTGWALSPAAVAGILATTPTLVDVDGRAWREVELIVPGANSSRLVGGVRLTYALSEQVMNLSAPIAAALAAAVAADSAPSVLVDVQLTAQRGQVVIDGWVDHAPRVLNHPLIVPRTLAPTGDAWTITTRHDHLTDGSLLQSAALVAVLPNGSRSHWLADPDGLSPFRDVGDSTPLRLDAQASTWRTTPSGVEIDWVFHVVWGWDDVASLVWQAAAFEADGSTTDHAEVRVGTSGLPAIEDDLTLVSLTPTDALGRRLDVNQLPGAAVIASGGRLQLEGEIRFAGTTHAPAAGEALVALLLDGQVMGTVLTGANGLWQTELDLPPAAGLMTLEARLLRIGPEPGVPGAEQQGPSLEFELELDGEAPELLRVEVLTSSGPLPADGLQWDEPHLDLRLIVADTVRHGDTIDVEVWIESEDDDGDGVAQALEYQRHVLSIPGGSDGEVVLAVPRLDVSQQAEGERISVVVNGSDRAGWTVLGGGSHGLADDVATILSGPNHATILPSDQVEFEAPGGWLRPGHTHRLSFVLIDDNPLASIDHVEVQLAGASAAPRAAFTVVPATGALQVDPGSGLMVTWNGTTLLRAGQWRIDLDIVPRWDGDLPAGWQVPDLRVWDDGRWVATAANVADQRWQLDRSLGLEVDALRPTGSAPVTAADGTPVVRPGDRLDVDVRLVHPRSGLEAQAPDHAVVVRLAGSIGPVSVASEATLGPDGTGVLSLQVPPRAPDQPLQSLTLSLLDGPAAAGDVADLVIDLAVDAVAPSVSRPPGVLVALESDRLERVPVTVHVEDAVAVAPSATLVWQWRDRAAQPIGERSSLPLLVDAIDGTLAAFSAHVDLRPPAEHVLRPDDVLSVWVLAADVAGHNATGAGTVIAPWQPAVIVRTVEPVVSGLSTEPAEAVLGQRSTLSITIVNEGNRRATLPVELVERLPDGRLNRLGDTQVELIPDVPVVVVFDYGTWRAGEQHLLLRVDGVNGSLHELDTPRVATEEDQLLAGIIAADDPVALAGLVIMVLGALAVVVLIARRPQSTVDVLTHEEDDGDLPDLEDPASDEVDLLE